MNNLPIPPMPGMGAMLGMGAMPPEGDELKQLCLNQQTDDVNDEWETELKDKMPQEIKEIMNAICQRLSTDGGLNSCNDDDAEDTVKLVDYMTSETEKLIREFISGDETEISHHLLHYVPTLPKLTQGGGGNLFGNNCTPDNTAKYVQTEQDKFLTKDNLDHYNKLLPMEIQVHNNSIKLFDKKLIGNNKDDEIKQFKTKQEESRKEISIKEDQQTLITSYDKNTGEGKDQLLKAFGKDMESLEKEFNEKNNCKHEDSNETSSSLTNTAGNLATTALENNPNVILAKGVGSVASGAASGVGSVASGAASGVGSVASGVGSLASGAASGVGSLASGAASVPDGDANVAALKNTKKYEIEDGDAKTILKHYTSHFIKLLKCDSNTAELLKTKIIDTMFISIKNKLIINKQELFGSIAKETTKHCIEKRIALIKPTIEVYQNIISTAPAPEQILPNYLRLILELFVYNHYNDLLNSEKLPLTTVELSIHINKLKDIVGINESLKGLTDNSVKEIIDLNKVPSPKTEEEEEETNNNEEALKQFKKLFEEEELEEKKGGGRKKHTRKKKRHHKKRRSTRRYR